MAEKKQTKEVKPEKVQAKTQSTGQKPEAGQAVASKLAVVLIRNIVRAPDAVTDTLKMLRLNRKHACTIINNTPSTKGMLNKVKDYTTYGTINEETIKLLEEKRGKGSKTFALCPPRGGFERKGIKRSFTSGGVLGNRRDKINNLIQKML